MSSPSWIHQVVAQFSREEKGRILRGKQAKTETDANYQKKKKKSYTGKKRKVSRRSDPGQAEGEPSGVPYSVWEAQTPGQILSHAVLCFSKCWKPDCYLFITVCASVSAKL